MNRKIVLALAFITTGLTSEHAIQRIDYAIGEEAEGVVKLLSAGSKNVTVSPDALIDSAAIAYNKKMFGLNLEKHHGVDTAHAFKELLMETVGFVESEDDEVQFLCYNRDFFNSMTAKYRLVSTLDSMCTLSSPIQLDLLNLLRGAKETGALTGSLKLGSVWDISMALPYREDTQACKILELYAFLQQQLKE